MACGGRGHVANGGASGVEMRLTVLVLVALTLAIPTLENARYLAPAYGAVAILSGYGYSRLTERATLRITALFFLLAAAAWQWVLVERFVRSDAMDLSARMIWESFK